MIETASQKNLNVAIAFVGALAVGIISLVFCLLPTGECAGWWSTLVATLIGAGLAVAGGVWLFYYQARKTDNKRREELRKLLRAELQETIQEINQQDADKYVKGEETGQIYIQPLVIEHVIRSGLFPVPFVQKLLSLARQFHTYNVKVSRLLAIIGRTSKYDDTPEHLQEVDEANWGAAQTAGVVKDRCTKLLKDPELL